MVLSIKQITKANNRPYYNEVGFLAGASGEMPQPHDYAKIIRLIKSTPEAVGILNAIATDICSDGFKFNGAKKNVELAQLFISKNQFKTEFNGTILDYLALGNGGLWKGRINAKQLKEAVEKVSILSGVEYKESEVKQIVDEEASKTKILKSAPWSTMLITMSQDNSTISGYVQKVGGREVHFGPEEMIHGKFMPWDGRVSGYSPMEACVPVLTTLKLIKDLNGNFFQNGGVPDWMFVLPKEMAGSPQVAKLEQTLTKYKNSQNKHGSLVFTGEVTPIQMNKFDKDMEFRQLAIYYTGILALAMNMPIARVSAIIGSEVSGGTASTDLSEAGYWKSISAIQDYWEDLLNSQLFQPEFKVDMRFNRGYRNDEIKETQRDAQAFDVLNKLVLAGAVKPEYVKFKMQIPDEYWTNSFTPIPVPGTVPMDSEGNPDNKNNPANPSNDSKKGDAQQANNERKKEQAVAAMERKEMGDSQEIINVSKEVFMQVVQKWVKSSTTRRVEYEEYADRYTMYVPTKDIIYKLDIGKDNINEVELMDIHIYGRRIK